jgi:hypothetical protein
MKRNKANDDSPQVRREIALAEDLAATLSWPQCWCPCHCREARAERLIDFWATDWSTDTVAIMRGDVKL